MSEHEKAARGPYRDAEAEAELARQMISVEATGYWAPNCSCAIALRAENEALREALGEIRLIAEEEPYKVVAGQKPCKHTAAINEIYAVVEAALAKGEG